MGNHGIAAVYLLMLAYFFSRRRAGLTTSPHFAAYCGLESIPDPRLNVLLVFYMCI